MKGQSALEFLMVYGWSLLIILVVGASLFALGAFDSIPDKYVFTEDECVQWTWSTSFTIPLDGENHNISSGMISTKDWPCIRYCHNDNGTEYGCQQVENVKVIE